MRARVAGTLVFAVAALAGGPARAQPETPGPHPVTDWDAGSVEAAGASLPTHVFFPADGGGPHPVVAVVHGASRNGSFMRVLAETVASRGLVAVVPTIPCNFFGCNHDENAAQLSALLDWAVAQGSTEGSPIDGLVDGERRGLIGHSWGALASHLAAARDDAIDAVVLLDPNDDGTVGRDAAGAVRAPTLQLLAERSGVCNNQWNEAAVTGALPAPKLQLTVAGSAHCDPEDPTDGLCDLVCGGGDRATTPYFRRYAVAWIACTLAADEGVASWAGGPSLDEDVAAGLIAGVAAEGLETLPCRTAPGADADADADGPVDGLGPEDAGGGPDADEDSGGDADAGGDGEPDVAADGDVDAGDVDAGPEAHGDGGGGEDGGPGRAGGGGCGCRAAGGGRRGAGSALALLVALAVLGRRSRSAR